MHAHALRVQVPFFGDQPFWGECCHRVGVGPRPVPIARLSTKDLMAAFEAFDAPEVRAASARVKAQVAAEDGVASAVRHFHECAPAPPCMHRRPRAAPAASPHLPLQAAHV
jgi:UDP:flavonoid glycosyltransferase YjiC (YdhE family)